VPLSGTPKRIRPSLDAVELDAPRAFARWLNEHRRPLGEILEHGTWLDREDVDALMQLSIPGVDELMGILEIDRLAHPSQPSRAYDLIVVDTAPTGHTLRLLSAPETVAAVAEVLGVPAFGAQGGDRGAFVSGPWGALVSVSPELFLERHGRSVRSAPIKGTIPLKLLKWARKAGGAAGRLGPEVKKASDVLTPGDVVTAVQSQNIQAALGRIGAAPSPQFQAAILDPAPRIDPPLDYNNPNGLVPYGNLAANGLSAEAPMYQTIFNYYNNARNFASPTPRA
jgi:hypothetical protein